MTTVDLRPGSAVLALPDDSDADVTITAVDSAGDAVDLTGNAFTVDILSDGSVLLAATMDLTDIATGVIVAGFDDDDLSAITATGLRWRLRNTTAEKNWITGSCSVSSDGTASSASQSVSVVVDSSTLTVTLGAVGAGPAGSPGPAGADGNTVLYGSGAPDDGADGVDGNFYIDTDGPTLYGPKAAGSWPAGVSMVGPAGSGSGDVIGPASATDNAVVLFNGTTGKLVKDSTTVLGDAASKNVGTGSGHVSAGDAPASAVSTHNSDTTSVHGIADTADLVTGPASSVDTEILRADGTSGKVAQGSGVAFDASALTGTRTLTMPDEDVDLGALGGGGAIEVISDSILGTTAAAFAFSSISGGYTSLVVEFAVRCNSGLESRTLSVNFNGDTGSNYGFMYTDGQSGAWPKAAGAAAATIGNLPGAASTAGYSATGRMVIPNYAATVFNKVALTQIGTSWASNPTKVQLYQGQAFWESTAAITSITFAPQSGSFVVGSRFTLYGVA